METTHVPATIFIIVLMWKIQIFLTVDIMNIVKTLTNQTTSVNIQGLKFWMLNRLKQRPVTKSGHQFIHLRADSKLISYLVRFNCYAKPLLKWWNEGLQDYTGILDTGFVCIQKQEIRKKTSLLCYWIFYMRYACLVSFL